MTEVGFKGVDGLRLAADRFDPEGDAGPTGGGPPALFLHGGGQTRHSWGGTARRVAARGMTAYTLDARGHGDSDWAPDGNYRLSQFAGDVEAVVGQVGDRPVLVGASLGGLTSILLTGELSPGVARAVVLVDIVPDMEPAGAERIRAFMAERANEGFASLEEAADLVAGYNTHRERPPDPSGLAKNLRERDGRWYWHWDPRFMDPSHGKAPSEIMDVDRLHAAVGRMAADVPVLLVRGRMSDLVSEEKAEDFLRRFPAVEFVDVSGAGHMVAGDRNDAFTDAVLAFLDRHQLAPG